MTFIYLSNLNLVINIDPTKISRGIIKNAHLMLVWVLGVISLFKRSQGLRVSNI